MYFNKLKKSDLITKSINTSTIYIIGAVIGFVVQIVQARVFGAEYVGIITLAFSLISTIATFTVFGFDQYLIKLLPRGDYNNKDVINKILRIELPILIILSLFFYFFSNSIAVYFNKSLLNEVVKIFSFFLPIIIIDRFVKSFLIILGGSSKNALIDAFFLRIIRLLFYLLGYCFYVSGNIYYFALVFFISFLICFSIKIILINILKKKNPSKIIGNQSRFIQYNELIRNTFPFFGITSAYFAANQIDKIVAGRFLSSTELGVYAVVVTVASFINLFSSGFIAFWPEISRLFYENKMDELSQTYRNGVRIVLLFSSPFIAWLIFYPEVLLFFFGKEFLIGSISLSILIIGKFLDVAVGPVGAILIMTKYSWLDAINGIVLFLSTFILNLIFVPRFGITGAALATSISIGSINLIKVLEVRILLNIKAFNKKELFFLIPFIISVFIRKVFNISNEINFRIIFLVILILFFIYIISFIIFFLFDLLPESFYKGKRNGKNN